jgi:hypothetical protein
MLARRSARLHIQETQELVLVQQPTPVEDVRNNKKRAPAAHAEESTRAKKKAIKSATSKAKEPPSQAQFSLANDTLLSLPTEVLYLILNDVSR